MAELPRSPRIPPGPSQESVWDYPRPPRLEAVDKHLRVIFNGETIAETQAGYRVLETSHPPVYYFPPQDVQGAYLRPVAKQTYCEWKGWGSYYDVVVGEKSAPQAGWFYGLPTPDFAAIQNYLAFYAGPMDGCYVDGELVTPQPGQFYGGWITKEIIGPFKGGLGISGW
ncbi:DUF427 domain-containing protein [Thermosynechococcaceae cyanobacterium BACA0444]|uniref:DUF427 domain-containing protein n=1 Tax=Pseudocalidococcus azoricus BACA0444 TaxID=2918990 RepID=A0AAE4FSA5_9CYAN|nr:DUF427 domain-containing protein [Pseudocalidococcus azoricus]MDS3860402.1 DUF427 domain-containing protein [Pseudocalidococcus azoricus BACA0444]